MASQLRIAGDAQKHRARKAEFEREAAREQRDTTEASISEYSKRAKTAEDDRDAAASAAERDVRTMQRGAGKADSQTEKITLALSNQKDQLEAANLQLAIMKDVQAENQRLKAQVAKLSASDPALLRRLQDERSQLRADVHSRDIVISNLRADCCSKDARICSKDARIKELEELLAKQPKPWVPRRLAGAGSSRGMHHDERTRLLYAKLLTLRGPPSELGEIVASCAYAILAEFPDVLATMKLPSDRFCRLMRPELGVLHRMVSAITVGEGELLCIANDASPQDGRELGATVGRVRSVVKGESVIRQTSLAGCYEMSDFTAKGEAVAIKEKCFDRCVTWAVLFWLVVPLVVFCW